MLALKISKIRYKIIKLNISFIRILRLLFNK